MQYPSIRHMVFRSSAYGLKSLIASRNLVQTPILWYKTIHSIRNALENRQFPLGTCRKSIIYRSNFWPYVYWVNLICQTFVAHTHSRISTSSPLFTRSSDRILYTHLWAQCYQRYHLETEESIRLRMCCVCVSVATPAKTLNLRPRLVHFVRVSTRV